MASNPPPSGAQWPPPASGSMAPQSFVPPYTLQYRPGVSTQQGQQFIPSPAPQQFHPPGQLPNHSMPPGQTQPPFTQLLMPRPAQPGNPAPSSYPQPGMPITSTIPQHQTIAPSHGVSFSSSYTFAPPSFGLPQSSVSVYPQFQPSSQMSVPVGGLQPWLQSTQNTTVVSPFQQASQQAITSSSTVTAGSGSTSAQPTASDWQEFEAADGRRYYYNKVTKQSSWEKPLDLMTPLERADASTVWKEFTTPEGRKYYYNKETKQSKWTIPDELKLAREQAEKAANATSNSPASAIATSIEQPSSAIGFSSSDAPTNIVTEPPAVSAVQSETASTVEVTSVGETVASIPSEVMRTSGVPVSTSAVEDILSHAVASPSRRDSVPEGEETKKETDVAGQPNSNQAEEKTIDDEPLTYATKQEAKNAFKALLESSNVEADWTWDQAMRVAINDKRYGALKILGERKQAFNEYIMQRKKVEAEERRIRQRKAKEDFVKMLEECEELTSSMRWSKAASMFEDDQRFKAVELEADREDLFRNYMVDLHKKERAKAQEESHRNRLEFRQFLESCSFIKVDSQWRKVQDLLEDDERCTRLDKLDRLDIFQDYIRDLEREEEEQKKRQKEQMRRAERKNRDAFRNMMDEHIAAGTLTAKTLWRDYCQKVKDSESYEAVALNTSGSTPKDLFEDAVEELEKRYDEDKGRIKDALKMEKVTVASSWTFDDFKSAIGQSIDSSVSDINLQLIYEDLIDRAKEKEEKEAKKRKRLAKDFTDRLSSIKEINESSSWEECKPLVEDSSEYRAIGDQIICKEIFDDYVSRLQEKLKEKERKREEEKAKKEREREEKDKKKDKDRREKEKDKERDKDRDRPREREDEAETEYMDGVEDYRHKDDKKKEKDKERKHRKRHSSTNDDISSDDDKDDTKKSHRHSSDRKKSRKHGHSPDSDSESRHKRHKRDRKDGSKRSGGHEELEDGEVGEDGEIQ